jgi:hypothetical protein
MRASLIVDQSPPNTNSVDMTFSRDADDFALTGASTVANINFWYQANFETDLADVTYAIYADSGGSLGTLLYTGTAIPTTSADVNAFFASFAVPNLALGAGTYWLELHSGTSLTDTTGFNVWWANADDNGTHPALSDPAPGSPLTPLSVSGFEQFAFQLDGTGPPATPPPGSATPEPAAALLTGPALVAVFLVRARLRR